MEVLRYLEMWNCDNCLKSETKTCESCEKDIYQHKEYKANLKETKKENPQVKK